MQIAITPKERSIITFREAYTLYGLFTFHLTNVIFPIISLQNGPENDISLEESLTSEAPAEVEMR